MIMESTGVETRRQVVGATAPLQQRIEAARLFALSGQIDSARHACAALIQEELPAFEADRSLLRPLIEVLLLSQAFRQISRLLRAIDASEVVFLPASAAGSTAEPFLLHTEGSSITIMLDTAELQRPRAAALARLWAERILRATGAAAPAPSWVLA